MSSETTLEGLPNEMLELIFFWVACDDPHDLLSLCLVSRVFRLIAQPLLSFHVHVNQPHKFLAGIRRFLHRPELRSRVKYLTQNGNMLSAFYTQTDLGRSSSRTYLGSRGYEPPFTLAGLSREEKYELAAAAAEAFPGMTRLRQWQALLELGMVDAVFALLLVWFDGLDSLEWRMPQPSEDRDLSPINKYRIMVFDVIREIAGAWAKGHGNSSLCLPLKNLRHVCLKQWDMKNPNWDDTFCGYFAAPFFALPNLKSFHAISIATAHGSFQRPGVPVHYGPAYQRGLRFLRTFPEHTSSVEEIVLQNADIDLDGLRYFANASRSLKKLSCQVYTRPVNMECIGLLSQCVRKYASTLEELEFGCYPHPDQMGELPSPLRRILASCTKLRRLEVPMDLVLRRKPGFDDDGSANDPDDLNEPGVMASIFPPSLEHFQERQLNFKEAQSLIMDAGAGGKLKQLKRIRVWKWRGTEDEWNAAQQLAAENDVQMMLYDLGNPVFPTGYLA
jgi:hypothetical protein